MEFQLQLVLAMARVVRTVLNEAMVKECNGCMVNHASQIHHECLMLSGEDRIRFCLDRAILLVDWEKVKEGFWNQITLDVMEWPSCFWDDEWIQNLWNDEDWREQLVSALVAQESEAWASWRQSDVGCSHESSLTYIAAQNVRHTSVAI